MGNSEQTGGVRLAEGTAARAVEKRIILSMGGKGGVGKTSFMATLAEWFDANEIPVKLLDLDSENKTRGSLTHFFGGAYPKSTSTLPPDWTPSSTNSPMVRRSFSPIWEPGPAR